MQKKGENTPLLIRYKDLKQHSQEAKRKRLQRSSCTFFLAPIEAIPRKAESGTTVAERQQAACSKKLPEFLNCYNSS